MEITAVRTSGKTKSTWITFEESLRVGVLDVPFSCSILVRKTTAKSAIEELGILLSKRAEWVPAIRGKRAKLAEEIVILPYEEAGLKVPPYVVAVHMTAAVMREDLLAKAIVEHVSAIELPTAPHYDLSTGTVESDGNITACDLGDGMYWKFNADLDLYEAIEEVLLNVAEIEHVSDDLWALSAKGSYHQFCASELRWLIEILSEIYFDDTDQH